MRHLRFPFAIIALLFILTPIAAQRPIASPSSPSATLTRAVDSIVNGGFETAGGSGWTSYSTNGFNAFCTNASCPTHSSHSGTGFIWLGGDGIPPSDETTVVEQPLTISSGNLTLLTFYLKRVGDGTGSPDWFVVSLSGRWIFSTLSNNVTYDGAYAEVTVNLSAFADDQERTLTFAGYDTSLPITSWLVDDISITVLPTNGNLIDQPGFEHTTRAPLDPKWKLSSFTAQDKVVCDKPAKSKYVSHSGDCSFSFKPGTAQTKLTQTIKASELDFQYVVSDDLWSLSWWTSWGDAFAESVKFVYAVPCPARTMSTRPAIGEAATGPRSFTVVFSPIWSAPQPFPCVGTIKKIKVSFKHISDEGKDYIDDVNFVVYQPALRYAAGVLPLPVEPAH